jgi:hypothetical protein
VSTEDDKLSSWRADVATIVLMMLGQIAFAILSPDSRILLLSRLAHVGWCLACLGWLVARRRQASTRELAALFVIAGAPLFYVFWLDEMGRAALPGFWIPFTGPKLSVFGVALLAPSLWLGTVLIVLFAVETVALAMLFHLAGRPEVAAGEPWVTLVYSAIAFGLLFDRVRRRLAEQAAVRAQARSEAMARLARVALAVRDLANTPLQTLVVNAALLRERPGAPEPTARMNRAFDQLRELNRVLARLESSAAWAPGDESFDALEVLLREAPPSKTDS